MTALIRFSEETVGDNYPSVALIIVIIVILMIIIAIDIKRSNEEK